MQTVNYPKYGWSFEVTIQRDVMSYHIYSRYQRTWFEDGTNIT